MNIEQVFFIYRRLAKKSIDLCEKIEICRDYGVDLEISPMSVVVKFIPEKKRDLKREEKKDFKVFCDYHNLEYYFNEKGEMIWQQKLMIHSGNKKHGKM